METRNKYCKHCGSPTKLSLQSEKYNTDTGKLIGKHYWNECTRVLCRWGAETTFQRLFIREEEE